MSSKINTHKVISDLLASLPRGSALPTRPPHIGGAGQLGGSSSGAFDLSSLRSKGRNFAPGETYEPADLKAGEEEAQRAQQMRYTLRNLERRDPFEGTRIDLNAQYKNVALLNEYVSDLGRIQSRRSTGLNAANQRKVSKLIRRARAFGILPVLERHHLMSNSRQI